MGIFTSPKQNIPYVPNLSANQGESDGRSTFLGGTSPGRLASDSSVVRTSGETPTDRSIGVSSVEQSSVLGPRRGIAPFPEPTPDTKEFQDAMTKAVGHPVMLPNGSSVDDSTTDKGVMMSPVADLRPVAEAGRRARKQVEEMLRNPETAAGASPYLYAAAGMNVGQGGVFDYQREGNHAQGFVQYPHFRNVSNFNVGLFAHQAGMSLEETLRISGAFSRLFGRTDTAQPYALQKQTADFIKKGFEASASGVYDEPAVRR